MVAVDVVHFATIPMPRAYAFRPGLRPERWWATIPAACLAFVLRHPEHGVVLVDTGLHPRALEDPAADFGPMMGRFLRALKPVGAAFDAQLRERGVEPEAVERVVMTHLHGDHTSAMRVLPNARFTIDRREWAAAKAARAALKGYVGAHLPSEDRVDLVDAPLDLLGDGSVRLLATPGHTPGHVSVLVQTAAHGEVLLAGDAAYTLRSIEEQRLPLLTDDDRAARASLRELAGHERVVPSHDPDAWKLLA